MDFGAHYDNFEEKHDKMNYPINTAYEILCFIKFKRSHLNLSKIIKKPKHDAAIQKRLDA
jgi:hypothetical protein